LLVFFFFDELGGSIGQKAFCVGGGGGEILGEMKRACKHLFDDLPLPFPFPLPLPLLPLLKV